MILKEISNSPSRENTSTVESSNSPEIPVCIRWNLEDDARTSELTCLLSSSDNSGAFSGNHTSREIVVSTSKSRSFLLA